MISKDDMMQVREDLVARREELMRRAQEIREQFADHVDEDLVVNAAGWTLVSTGMALGVTEWILGRRRARAFLLPVLLLAGGFALLGGGFMRRRSVRVDEAETIVRQQLAALDPIARFRVIREVGQENLPFVRHSHN